MWSLQSAQAALIVAGCLGTAFTQIITSAAAIHYTHALGGAGLHIGLLNALPTGMQFLQLASGLAASRLTTRRWAWFSLSMVQRTLLVPFALGPWLAPQFGDAFWVWAFLFANVLVHGLGQLAHPLWMSWMGDYLPRNGLNSYWGIRQSWMNWMIAGSQLLCAVYVLQTGLDIRESFAHLAILAAVFGVGDLLLHLPVEEPRRTPTPQTSFRAVFIAPLRHAGFRSFIGYACMWHFAAMIGAPFISLYLLQYVGMSLFQVLLLWSMAAVGGALTAGRLGRFAERYGSRPLLVGCTLFKSINMLVLLLVPRDPTIALWMLTPAFMFDAVLNVGIQIGQDGFLLKQSPSKDRAMFMASGTAIAGFVGCVTSVACGQLLTVVHGLELPRLGVTLNGFHLLFWTSLVMRLATLRWVIRIEEPAAQNIRSVLSRSARRAARRAWRTRVAEDVETAKAPAAPRTAAAELAAAPVGPRATSGLSPDELEQAA